MRRFFVRPLRGSTGARCAAVRCLHGRAAVLPAATTTVVAPSADKQSPGPFGSCWAGGRVSGSVAEGWEDVREAFEKNFAENLEVGAQLVVFKEGVPVVDLHGHAEYSGLETERADDGYDIDCQAYSGDALQNIFSSGKNLEAICIMMLVDRGQLAYTDRVADHWPAFGQHGKEHITVEDVLRHESGLQFFANPADPDDFGSVRVPTIADVEKTADGAVERLIEGSAAWGHGQRMYHASTRGFVLGGLVRQITGKTLGSFIAAEIAGPLGQRQTTCFHSAFRSSQNFSCISKRPKPAICFILPRCDCAVRSHNRGAGEA